MVADLLAISQLFPFVHLPTTFPKFCNPDLRPSHPSLLPPFMFLSSNPSTVFQSFLCFSPASHFLSFGRFHLCPAMVLSDFSLEFLGLSSLAMLALPPPTFCFSFSFFLSLPLVTFSGIFLPKGCLAAADVLFFGFGFEFVGISCVFGRDLLCWFLQMVACCPDLDPSGSRSLARGLGAALLQLSSSTLCRSFGSGWGRLDPGRFVPLVWCGGAARLSGGCGGGGKASSRIGFYRGGCTAALGSGCSTATGGSGMCKLLPSNAESFV